MVPSRRLLLPLVLLALLLAAYSWWAASPGSASSPQQRAQAAALTYARGYMTWSRGPVVQQVVLSYAAELPSAMRRLPAKLQEDFNAADFAAHNRGRVALVVLRGVYYSLPPDEGEYISGNVLVVVNARTDRVLTLTA